MSEFDRTQPPPSPCVGVCTLDEDDLCMGCSRTMDEIGQWGTMTPDQQWAVVDDLPNRLPDNGTSN